MKKLRKSEIRKRLFEKEPHCCYCGRLTKEYLELYTTDLPKGFHMPDDAATVEHLYDKYDYVKRWETRDNPERHAIACYKCNQERGNERQREYADTHRAKRKEFLDKVRVSQTK